MAIKGFRGRDSEPSEASETSPLAHQTGQRKDQNVKSCTYIDEGSELSGNLRFSEPVTIDGRVQGEIACLKGLVIGETASVNSSISCDSVVVFGELKGEVDAKSSVTIHKSARVSAQIKTEGVVIERGSKFKGLIQVGDDDSKPAISPKPAQTSDTKLTKPGGGTDRK